jgi:hypothetical protein
MSFFLSPALRRSILTAHITFSVGWLGAVGAFLALAIAGLKAQDVQLVRSAYIAMEVIGWYVIVPACIGSFFSGMVNALGTQWGLFRHYWVTVKFILTLATTAILLLHMQPIGHMAGLAAKPDFLIHDTHPLQIQLVANAVAPMLVLLVITAISVYKPWGCIELFQRKRRSTLVSGASSTMGRTTKLVLIGTAVLLLLFVIMHLMGGGLGMH